MTYTEAQKKELIDHEDSWKAYRYQAGELMDMMQWIQTGYKDSTAKDLAVDLLSDKIKDLQQQGEAHMDSITFLRKKWDKEKLT